MSSTTMRTGTIAVNGAGIYHEVRGHGPALLCITGGAQDANSIPVRKENADLAMDAAACIGCGACVAACPNASAMLFTSAKISHLALLPQGQPERPDRARRMVARMDAEGFGTCTNHGECEAACPKGIRMQFIGMMNADFTKYSMTEGRRPSGLGEGGAG